MKTTLERRLFTADEYEQMGQAGILDEDERIELIGGEIVKLSPIGGPHVYCVNLVNRHLVPLVGPTMLVSIQNPIRLGARDEPQPDVVVYMDRQPPRAGPWPCDVLLVIEVTDTSQQYDRTVKLPRYAAAGIPETWIFDLKAHTLERYSEPGPAGYAAVARAGRGEALRSLVLPSVTFVADELLG